MVVDSCVISVKQNSKQGKVSQINQSLKIGEPNTEIPYHALMKSTERKRNEAV